MAAFQRRQLAQSPRGVSLIEALVALAVMSFGMLALVGVQATMRFNSDVARQRTEATRLATEELESLRLFSDVVPSPSQLHASWDELATSAPTSLQLPSNTANTSFSMDRTVVPVLDRAGNDARIDPAAMKVVQVVVRWSDRTNANNQAVLDGLIMGVAPALSAQLSIPASPAAPSQRGGRHVSIPVTARDLGDGTSAFKPFNQGTAVWVLNQTTGLVTSLCTGVSALQNTITTADLSNCTTLTVSGRLVTGTVQFDLRSTTVDASTSEAPQGPVLPLKSSTPLAFYDAPDNAPVNLASTPLCVAEVPASPSLALQATRTAYACIVFPASADGWGGKLDLLPGDYPDGTPGNWSIGTSSGQYRVCRYTTASTEFTDNNDHPKTYCRVKQVPSSQNACTTRVTQSLSNQNFLVIQASQSCPTDTAIDPAAGNLVNSNTLPHQP